MNTEAVNDPEQYIKKAKELALETYKGSFDTVAAAPDDFYVVWFSKTLQNWKALVSTDLRPGLYYEVTYNGDRKVTYVDFYRKATNIAFPDKD